MSTSIRPRLALTLGDPAGIGPEIVAAALADEDLRERARLCVLGPRELRGAPPFLGLPVVERGGLAGAADQVWMDSSAGSLGEFELGRAQASCGRAALDALRLGHELALAGESEGIAGLVTAPVCKEAMHLAGEPVEGQTQLLARWARAEDCQMMAIAGQMRVLLATRHMALRAALDSLTPELVVARLRLLDASLRGFGIASPRLALAGINPHASEGGLFGDDEERVLEPALAVVRAEGIEVTGPEPADTVFVRAARGRFDAVLALYHDQGFIPVKLAAPTTGVTVLVGMPYLRVSPAHGTAFDIAGKGEADPENLLVALRTATDLLQG
ncbi:MAG: 4-hydroxythreonine-4-phosphate dehydrogenase PdxA [Planctomycetota bacterium]|nr:4-hydroxythreonine-4-phosphate dehydrogenase PdxA [Planctomycetota bacterium]